MFETTDREIEDRVVSMIEGAIADKQPTAATWVTHHVVGSYEALPDDATDAGFYIRCAYGHVRAIVRRVVRRYRPEEETDRQLVLPGYERLQVAYLVTREKEQTVVPVECLSDDEINAKCEELESMAIGCFLHIKELKRYRDERAESATAS